MKSNRSNIEEEEETRFEIREENGVQSAGYVPSFVHPSHHYIGIDGGCTKCHAKRVCDLKEVCDGPVSWGDFQVPDYPCSENEEQHELVYEFMDLQGWQRDKEKVTGKELTQRRTICTRCEWVSCIEVVKL